MTTDPTEDLRRAMVPEMPAELQARLDAGEQVWTTTEMTVEFAVEGFMAPFVVVRRRSDNAKGTLMFTHQPRWYFGACMTQTAIIIKHAGEEVLVRISGFLINAELIDVDTRGKSWESWQPVPDETVEVRLEGSKLEAEIQSSWRRTAEAFLSNDPDALARRLTELGVPSTPKESND